MTRWDAFTYLELAILNDWWESGEPDTTHPDETQVLVGEIEAALEARETPIGTPSLDPASPAERVSEGRDHAGQAEAGQS